MLDKAVSRVTLVKRVHRQGRHKLQMVDGNFSATHRRRQEGSGVPSAIAPIYFRNTNPNLSATAPEKKHCSTNLVAASNVACRDKQNDISGIVCYICRHGVVEDVYGESVIPFSMCSTDDE